MRKTGGIKIKAEIIAHHDLNAQGLGPRAYDRDRLGLSGLGNKKGMTPLLFAFGGVGQVHRLGGRRAFIQHGRSLERSHPARVDRVCDRVPRSSRTSAAGTDSRVFGRA